jgi:hypothetical protein
MKKKKTVAALKKDVSVIFNWKCFAGVKKYLVVGTVGGMK